MKTNRTLIAFLVIVYISIISSCKKDFLNEKPSTDIVQPITLDDMSGLLENPIFSNTSSDLSIMSSDEYEYKDYNTWRALLKVVERNTYIWTSDLYGDKTDMYDWSFPYQAIFYSNTVISRLEEIRLNQDNTEKYMFLKGWAYFNRAYNFYILASSFCKNYDLETAQNELGLPLKVSADIDVIMQRSNLKKTYEQIFQDLEIAKQLLENRSIPTDRKTQPSLTAVYALEARIYLNMREYEKAELAADNCLALYSKLIDYNTIQLPTQLPFSLTNKEVIYSSCSVGGFAGALTTTANRRIKISESLLNLYSSEDLRLKIYFLSANGGFVVNKNYVGNGFYPFTGLATDEVYLVKAECAARRGDVDVSMKILNTLLINRFPSTKFMPVNATSPQQAFDIVLKERRKELVWRGARWEDLKRLNKEGANITITRLLNGVTYSLLPNDPKYIFAIPSGEIALSGIIQNIR